MLLALVHRWYPHDYLPSISQLNKATNWQWSNQGEINDDKTTKTFDLLRVRSTRSCYERFLRSPHRITGGLWWWHCWK